MSTGETENQNPQLEMPVPSTVRQGGQQDSNPLLNLVQKVTAPIQIVFSIRERTKQAKHKVQELQARVDRLEAEIEYAKGNHHQGNNLDRLR